MEARNLTSNGLFVTVNEGTYVDTSSGKPVVKYGSSSTETWKPKYVDQLYNVISQKGNRKTPNRHTYSRYVNTYLSGISWTRTQSGQTYQRSQGTGPHGSCPSRALPTDLYSAAYNRALGKITDELRGSVDLSVDIAQAGQTAGLLKSAQQALDYVRTVKSGRLLRDFADWRKGSRTIGNKWLEFQYGIKPLISSAYGCLDQVMNDSSKRMKFVHRATERQEYSERETFDGGRGLRISKGVRSCRVEISLHCAFRSSVAQTLQNYTSLNPASVVWELIPYSFVVDWFYDVGSYVRNLETAMLNASVFEHGYRTVGYLIEGTVSENEGWSDGLGNEIFRVVNGSFRRTSFDRALLSSWPMPVAPSFSAKLGSGRLLNAAALMAQHLKGK